MVEEDILFGRKNIEVKIHDGQVVETVTHYTEFIRPTNGDNDAEDVGKVVAELVEQAKIGTIKGFAVEVEMNKDHKVKLLKRTVTKRCLQ